MVRKWKRPLGRRDRNVNGNWHRNWEAFFHNSWRHIAEGHQRKGRWSWTGWSLFINVSMMSCHSFYYCVSMLTITVVVKFAEEAIGLVSCYKAQFPSSLCTCTASALLEGIVCSAGNGATTTGLVANVRNMSVNKSRLLTFYRAIHLT